MDRRERPSAEYATKIKNHVEKRWYAILEASYRESRGKYERARRVYEDNGIDMDF